MIDAVNLRTNLLYAHYTPTMSNYTVRSIADCTDRPSEDFFVAAAAASYSATRSAADVASEAAGSQVSSPAL